jgi:EAL domain-containing protein (putative c-di-GMP-specific phosphodiesterase class I)
VSRRLNVAGFGMALGNADSAHAGLEMMRMVPFEYVKIDRSIVEAATSPGIARATLKAVVAFAAEAGVAVILSGIDDRATLYAMQDALAGNDFRLDGLQGFLLARPSEGVGAGSLQVA